MTASTNVENLRQYNSRFCFIVVKDTVFRLKQEEKWKICLQVSNKLRYDVYAIKYSDSYSYTFFIAKQFHQIS